MISSIKRLWRLTQAVLGFASIAMAVPAAYAEGTAVAPQNAVEAIQAAQVGGATIVKITMRQPLASIPASFSIANPARVAIDLMATENALGRNVQAINEGEVRSANVVQVGDRTRLIFNLRNMVVFEPKLDGKDLLLTFAASAAAPVVQEGLGAQSTRFAEVKPADETSTLRDIKFRRGQNGEALISVDLSSANIGIDIRQQGSALVVDFSKTELPESLRRRLDVTDFATPVTSVNAVQQGENTRITIAPTGLWEHNAYQSDNQFVIEVKPVVEDPNKLLQGSRGRYQGERLTLNFQNIDVRAVLQVIADFTNFNIITSDSVGGTVTLRLKDVPWDQALDIILQSKGLSMRKNGDVIRIAPTRELAESEKAELEARKQLAELEMPRTESFQVNYQQAASVLKTVSALLLMSADQKAKFTGTVDTQTNKVFLTAPPSVLEEARKRIIEIDKPARQVLIEAKIVTANDKFSQNLGVRMSLFDKKSPQSALFGGQQSILVGGGLYSNSASAAGAQSSTQLFSTSSIVSGSSVFSVSLFNSSMSRILQLELAALESDDLGKTVASPRIITSNNQKASIKDGSQLPVTTPATSTSPATTTYIPVNLQLDVTPQITPDGRVKMQLSITKDTPDSQDAVTRNWAIKSSQIQTEVMVENGGTVVIGGVYSTEDTNSEKRIPFLGDLPYVGFLFKNKATTRNRQELLIFITPKVVDDRRI